VRYSSAELGVIVHANDVFFLCLNVLVCVCLLQLRCAAEHPSADGDVTWDQVAVN
jgi:hypothetical protein